jgi:hypothetical protein
MVEQRTANVRIVGWSLRQKEMLGIVLDAIQSLRSSARYENENNYRKNENWISKQFLPHGLMFRLF